MIKVSENDN